MSALRHAADGMGVRLEDIRGPESPTDSWRLIVADVVTHRGHLVATLGQMTRKIGIRIWSTGVGEIAQGCVSDLEAVVQVAHAWHEGITLDQLGSRWPFIAVDALALAHERGEAVAFQWQLVRDLPEHLVDHEIVEAAYADPVLRGLFPLVGHGSLQFSRCTHRPFSGDVPSLFPLGNGGWRVHCLWAGDEIPPQDAATAAEAVSLVVAGLPATCGPAVEGPLDRRAGA